MMSMRRLSRLAMLGMGVLSAGLLGCAQNERPPVSFQTEPWTFSRRPGTKIVTEHYEIYTTLKDQVLIEALPGFVEGAFEQYRKLIPPVRQPEGRMTVYLFATRGQWETFTRFYTGSRAPVFLRVRNGGYSERGVSVIEYVAHQITFPLFAHEGFHQYLYHYVNASVPAWLNEGLAVVCEGQKWGTVNGRYGLKEFDAWYNPARRNVLAQALIVNRLHSLRRLLETNAGEVIEGSSQSVATYYAQLWALMLFLREGSQGKYSQGFERMLSSLAESQADQQARAAHIWSTRSSFNAGEALFRGFIAEDIDAIEQEYFAFLRDRLLGTK